MRILSYAHQSLEEGQEEGKETLSPLNVSSPQLEYYHYKEREEAERKREGEGGRRKKVRDRREPEREGQKNSLIFHYPLFLNNYL